MRVPRILIIAGSDSSGGAGIQADIKTVTMLGGHAMTAITAITAQNTLGVEAVLPVPPEMVLQQIDAVANDIGVDAIKIGMIGSAAVAEAVADRLQTIEAVPIIFDPVMVASSGSALADAPTIAAFGRLMGRSTLITPNAPELAMLTGSPIVSIEDAAQAGRALAGRTGAAVLAKGGHLAGDQLIDLLIEPDGSVTRWSDERIDTRHNHGTGCTLASAIATGLGEGLPLVVAIEQARAFVRAALSAAPGFGAGHGPMGHWAAGPAAAAMNLNQVTVTAYDYAASLAFYRALGLRQIVDSPPRYARFECPGGATLSIHVEEKRQAGGGAVIYFESVDLDQWVERLKAQGLEFQSEPEDQPWLWREARLRDPAGNEICLYRAGSNRRFPPWRVD